MTLGDLISVLGGELVHGDPEIAVIGVQAPEEANGMDLVFADDAGAATRALDSGAAAAILKPGMMQTHAPLSPYFGVVEVSHPRLWIARAEKLLRLKQPSTGIHATAVIGSHVQLAEEVSIGPYVVIGEVTKIGKGTRIEAGAVIGPRVLIGEDCHIFPRVTIYSGTYLGNRVVVHAGAVLGADGFGYVRDPDTGAYVQFPQKATLTIEDDVEIGANTTVDRGSLTRTRIGRGTKIDNLVHVGHNCDIGEDVILVALTGISGSSTVGRGAVLAGQVGIGDHAHVGPGVILGGQSGVFNGKTVTTEGLSPGAVLYGTPARPLRQVLREQAVLARLAKKQGIGNRE
ncbi:MAG: UDP-3-O-(3-hydroxymyristoyl)glucosamine N-acyltransferase [Terracidiphilus sp.]